MMKKTSSQHVQVWRLFITANALLISAIDRHLHEAGQIPLNWYDVLIELYEAPNHRLRMSDLAERVLLTRSGLTRLVDRLEKEAFLSREIDPADRRGFYAILTDKGMEAMKKAWPIYAKGIAAYFADHLTEEEAVVLQRVFSKMIDHLQSEGGGE